MDGRAWPRKSHDRRRFRLADALSRRAATILGRAPPPSTVTGDPLLDVLRLDADAARLLRLMFDAKLYRRAAGLGDGGDGEAAFEHFLREGLKRGTPFSVYYDPGFCAAQLRQARLAADADHPADLLKTFLEEGPRARISPTPLFDEDFYGAADGDLGRAGAWGYRHYLEAGEAQGRAPSAPLAQLLEWAADPDGRLEPGLVRACLSATPASARSRLWSDGAVLTGLRLLIWPACYARQAGLAPESTGEQIESHFLTHGLLAGIRPNPLFNWGYYEASLASAEDAGDCPPLGAGENRLLHWLAFGARRNVSPSPLFDRSRYLARYPDVARDWAGPAFQHYLLHGHWENRTASPVFDAGWYAAVNGLRPGQSALLHYMTEGETRGLRPHREVSVSRMPAAMEGTTRLESLAELIEAKARRLRRPAVAEAIARAATLCPSILAQTQPSQIHWPPFKHPAAPAAAAGKLLGDRLPRPRYDVVVFLPESASGKALDVAGELLDELLSRNPRESVLLVHAGVQAALDVRPCAAEVHVLHLTDLLESVGEDSPSLILLDLIRRVGPREVYNVDSDLGWLLYRQYSRQIAEDAVLYAYDFPAESGARGKTEAARLELIERCFPDISVIPAGCERRGADHGGVGQQPLQRAESLKPVLPVENAAPNVVAFGRR